MKPIYKPKGAAAEYGELALNIYTGCPHRCFYCYAPRVLHKDREEFHSVVKPRENILEETRRQLERERITGKLIHLCFTCDPYPSGYDSTVTREIIKLLKAHGNHVQILTKGDGSRDFDLLDENDWYGVTIDGSEKAKFQMLRIADLYSCKAMGIHTWVSFEPVIRPEKVCELLETYHNAMDKVRIGKLNYFSNNIDWKSFGIRAEKICKKVGLNYYIKAGLRAEMEKE